MGNRYFEERREFAAAHTEQRWTEVALKQVNAWRLKSGGHKVTTYNRRAGIFKVVTHRRNVTQTISLTDRTCDCGKWEMYRLPCSHLIAALNHVKINYRRYIDMFYSIQTLGELWAPQFYPVKHKEYWNYTPEYQVLPDRDMIRSRGRPQSTRIRSDADISDASVARKCRICHQPGHNRRTCPNRNRGGPSNVAHQWY